MQISRKSWLRYVNKLRAVDARAADLMLEYITTHGTKNTQQLIAYAYGLATKYGEASAALTAQIYDSIAELSGVHASAADVADTATYPEVAKTVNGTLKTGNPKIVSDAVGALVKKTGADTMLKNAIRDRAQFAWIPNGDTCAFCLTLASRGWQDATPAALKGGHAEHIHPHCDCQYCIRFNTDTTIEGYEPEKYLEQYEDAEGTSSKDKINALRRQHYAENKDEINAQKRAAYAAKKEREQ